LNVMSIICETENLTLFERWKNEIKNWNSYIYLYVLCIYWSVVLFCNLYNGRRQLVPSFFKDVCLSTYICQRASRSWCPRYSWCISPRASKYLSMRASTTWHFFENRSSFESLLLCEIPWPNDTL
jgi:hypothetical protein